MSSLNESSRLMAAGLWARLSIVPAAGAARSVSLMVAVGLALRLVTVWFVYDEQLTSPRGDFDFGWEAGRVAKSLAAGDGFSSPLWGETGPTAWLPPVYALLLAGVFEVFGTYTAASAVAILSLQGLFSALTAIPVALIARRIFGPQAAVWAGWGWAFFPYAIFINASRAWGEGLDALLLSLILWSMLRLSQSRSAASWFGCGLLVGAAVLVNPNTLSVMPGLWGWAAYRLRQSGLRWERPFVTAIIAMVIVVTPWLARNYLVFDQFLPFRSNFWLEFQLGNNPQSPVMLVGRYHPASNTHEFAEYRCLGELRYMVEKRRQALAFIATRPGTFIWLTIRRVIFVWTGFWSLNPRYLASQPLQVPLILFNTTLSVLLVAGLFRARRDRNRDVIPLAIMLVCQPLVYYLTHPAIEYRHALDPVMIMLGGAGLAGIKWIRRLNLAPH